MKKLNVLKYGLMLGAISLSMSLLATEAVEVVGQKSTPTTKAVTSQKKLTKAVKKAATKKVTPTKVKKVAKKTKKKGKKKTIKAAEKPGGALKEIVVLTKASYPDLPEFEQVEGWASDLSIGPDGKVIVVGSGNNIYERTKITDEDLQGEGWMQIPGVTAESWVNGLRGTVWALDLKGVSAQTGVASAAKSLPPQPAQPPQPRKPIIIKAIWDKFFRHEVTKEVGDAVNSAVARGEYYLNNATVGTGPDHLDFGHSSWQAKLFGSRAGLIKWLDIEYSFGDGNVLRASVKYGEPFNFQDPSVAMWHIQNVVAQAGKAVREAQARADEAAGKVLEAITRGHRITFRDGNGVWFPLPILPSGLVQIAVGSSGQAWGINNVKGNGGGQIFFLANVTIDNLKGSMLWLPIDGRLVQISCGAEDCVFGVNEGGGVHERIGITPERRMGTEWKFIATPEPFKWVSAGLDGSVWGVGRSGDLYCYTNKTWDKIEKAPKGLDKVYAGRGGELWLLTNDKIKNIYFTTYMAPFIPSGTVDNLNPSKEPAAVLVSYKDMKKPVLLKPEGKSFIVAASGANPKDCVIKPLWKRYEDKTASGWGLIIHDPKTGNNLGSNAKFENKSFDLTEQWIMIPADADGLVVLKNRETGADLGAALGMGSIALKIMKPGEAKKALGLKVEKKVKKEKKTIAKTEKKLKKTEKKVKKAEKKVVKKVKKAQKKAAAVKAVEAVEAVS